MLCLPSSLVKIAKCQSDTKIARKQKKIIKEKISDLFSPANYSRAFLNKMRKQTF